MRALAKTLAALCLLALALASPAQAAFGLNGFDVNFENEDGSPASKAGSHPFAMTTTFHVNFHETGGEAIPDGEMKDVHFELPVGFAGNPTAAPTCTRAQFLEFNNAGFTSCLNDSSVGHVVAEAISPGGTAFAPIYNLEPPPGVAAQLGFIIAGEPVTVDVVLTKGEPYNVSAASFNTPQVVKVFGAELTVWGNPASHAHDSERGSCLLLGGSCPVGPGVKEKPFITLPRACTPPLPTIYRATSWQEPEAPPVEGVSATALEPSECEQLKFAPTIKAKPTTASAESPSGLDFNLDISDPGLSEPEGTADSDIKKAVVTLPEGITTNPATASGLGACTQTQYESETLGSDPGTGCPESSKIGEVEVETPLLEEKILRGSIYVAKQHDNQFDNLLTIDMVIKDPKLGILVRAAGKVDPNPVTGQLTTTFDDLPQLPFSHFHLHFREGQRAPLITPPTCGAFTTTADLYPYSKPNSPLRETATFTVNAGADNAGCASSKDQLPNKPGFSAGTLDPAAGAYSPFVFKLDRGDGSQQLSSIATTLPEGLTGKLAGIPYCSDVQIAQAGSRSGEGQGALEQSQPSCPVASEVGTVTVGAGAGNQPYHVTGHAYLAGPYKGAPLSLEIVTPAIAGPFDLGAVAVRTALNVDPETAKITAVSDPIPSILHGLPLDVRSIALEMSRPSFTLNPTSCEPKSITGTATSTLGSMATLSQYFQARSCANLGFGPKLALKLKGGTQRSKNPGLRATLTYPQGSYANIAGAQVALPHSEFLDQSHIKTICTRVQFAVDACPKGSVYGEARATTPLLDRPLEGPVYLRSSSHNLPDLVADLNGQIEVVLVGRVDSVRGGIRTTFEGVPDAPVSSFVLQMQGGKKGLLVNSTDICRRKNRADVTFTAQNGKRADSRPTLQADCGRRHASHRSKR